MSHSDDEHSDGGSETSVILREGGKLVRPFSLDPENDPEEIALPTESIYALALIGPSCCTPEEFDESIGMIFNLWATINQMYIPLVVNFAIQGMLLYYFKKITDGYEPECPSDSWLRFICLAIFIAFVSQDMSETYKMFLWVVNMKTSRQHEEIKVAVSSSGETTLVSGLTLYMKIFNIVVIVLPKLVIGILILVIGCPFLAKSETDEDLLLNTLAAYFIVEIDEYMYTIFDNYFIKNALDQVPPVLVTPNMLCVICKVLGGNLVQMAVVAFFANTANERICAVS
jgi:hypothetical protein